MAGESKFLKYFMLILGSTQICFLGWIFYYHYMCMDHAEHIHASWLVWQGQVPYRDFFEHHNPLLWYIFAPITAIFYKSAIILYVSRVFTFLCYFVAAWGLSNICRDFLNISRTKFLLALMVFCLPYDNYYLLFELQPDALMWTFFFWGFWFFLRYLHQNPNQKSRELNFAFVLFMLSFLVLQKIIVILGILGGYTLFLLYRRKLFWTPVLYALIFPSIMALIFMAYLYYTNSWVLYFLFNYDLNYWMQGFMGDAKILQNWLIIGALPVLAIFSLHHFLEKENFYRNLLCAVMFLEFIQKMIVGAPYVQYFIFSNIISALIIADFVVDKIYNRYIKILLVGGVAAFIGLLAFNPPNTQYPRYYNVQNFIAQNSREDEPIINAVYFFFNLYGRNPSYYWFGYGNVARVAHYLYDVDQGFELNAAIRENLPMFVYVTEYINLLGASNKDYLYDFRQNLRELWAKIPVKKESEDDFVKRWSAVTFDEPNLAFLEHFYVMTQYYPLLIRKDLVNRIKIEQK